MIAAKLIELIEIHSDQLVKDIAGDLATNERTRGFKSVLPADLEQRLAEIIHHLGNWIGNPRAERVRAEFSNWGARRFNQKIPLSEIVYAIITVKRHLRRFANDHGLIDASFPRIDGDYVLPMHLHTLQEFNSTIGRFFDEALYYLASGYEGEAQRESRTPGV
jgi:hypothetical protein